MAELDDIFRRLDNLERQDGVLGRAVEDLRDALTVTAEIQRRQSEIQLGQAEWMERMQQRQDEHDERMREHERLQQHIQTNLSEITDKLNGLIGYLDNQRREPPQPSA